MRHSIVTPQGRTLVLTLPKTSYAIGDSILLNGICTTVTAIQQDSMSVDLMTETLRVSTAKNWPVGQTLNIEAPLTLQTKLSGSIISGHIDTIGTVTEITNQPNDYSLTIQVDKRYQPYLIRKGGITVDGVNLTIGQIKDNLCTVYIIPYTLTHTTLRNLAVNATVNVEFDYITKIVVHHFKKM